MAPANLVNLDGVEKGYASRTVLEGVTCGIADGERIGVVGRNGEGKTTLLRLLAGLEEPDAGAVVRQRGLQLAFLDQGEDLGAGETALEVLVGDRAEHEWAGDARFRAVLDGLLGGVGMTRLPDGPQTRIAGLSGGERRRIALARLLLGEPQLLLLDEPTNHLDVEAITWLAGHMSARRGAILVVTHDRWFLDAVCTATWEIDERAIHPSEGGYAAYVLARAERDRLQQALPTSGGATSSARSSRGCGADRRRGPRSRSSGSRRRTP